MTGNMIGRVFNNRYQITELIGVGGMAEVYRAQDNVLGRIVAVKVMLPQYAADPSFTQRFKQEAASAANLQSPYIVNIYDWGQDEGTYYIVMEYVRGSDLKSAINERGAINQRKVAEIGSQVCQALSVAHGLDIIHRDIKPQNIMVQPDGNVKVMDFGIARAKNSVKTQTSSVLGTAHYISPEQAQGKELTAASDIYSLGVVMYEAATGKLPFDADDAITVAMMQVNDLPPLPSEINPKIDPSLEAIIMKAMAKNPNERFATAKDMRQALNDFLAGRPVNLGDEMTSAETAVLGASDATAVLNPVDASESSSSEAKSYDSGNTQKKSHKKAKKVAAIILIIAAIAIIAFVAFSSCSSTETLTVPDVTGMKQEAAIEAIEEAGFEVGEITEENSDTVKSGRVISQDPEGNSEAEEGTTVNLVISLGAAEVEVPDLTGLSPEEAQKELTANGLDYEEGDAVYSDDVEEGLVAGQDIEAGTEVSQDTVITYYLSLGPEGTSVPNVTGESEGSASAELSNAGFYVTTEYASSDSVEEGYVISQSPSGGSMADPGSTVNIVVSTGPETQTYSVSVNANGGGDVSASASTVEEGDSVTITISPYEGYEVQSVSGLSGVSSSGGTYTYSNVTSNVNISVTFAQVETQETTPPSSSSSSSSSNSNSTDTEDAEDTEEETTEEEQ